MRRGLKVYRGAAAVARHYVEADRGRADDYLAEGTGIADRYAASPTEGVRLMEPLTGDKYEAWVAGVDPDTELHPDIFAAYDAAQDAAARQIIGWLAEHATTRIGPRGTQIQVPVSAIDAVRVRH